MRLGFLLAALLALTLLMLSVASAAEPDPLAPPHAVQTFASDGRYTSDGFAALSDEEKKAVYYGQPQLLPADFSSERYISLFHPELTTGGGN
jgi:hypothetical protein